MNVKPSIIEDLTKFDAALREIAIIDLRVAEANVTRKDEILVAEGKFTSRVGLLVGRRELLAEQLELFYRANRTELEKGGQKKSIELQFGRAGMKVSAPALRLLQKWTWPQVLNAIKGKYADFVRTEESIDKPAIKAARLTTEALKEIGLKIHQKEEFFFETFPANGGDAA